MNRFLLEVAYDGTAFHGSQIQGDLPTVQAAINRALSILLKQPTETFGASRTDEGVHAWRNYFHFDSAEALQAHFHYKLNAILSEAVSVNDLFQTDSAFNARFDAVSRTYRYRIYSWKNPFLINRAHFFPYKIDRSALEDTAAVIKDYRNFESFSKRASQTRTHDCHVYESYWEADGQELHYVVRANRFLRGMVRGLVSTQLQVARRRWSVDDFRRIVEAQDCTQADFNVPGHGLYLERVEYPKGALMRLNLM